MAEAALAAGSWRLPGLEVADDARVQIAALRYFEPRGPFADAVRGAVGCALPEPGTAAAAGELILAWLRPTETLVLTADPAALGDLMASLAGVPGGQVVELSGGLRVLRLAGARVDELMARLGSSSGAPRLNQARRGRLADLPVLALSVRADEVLLAVERAYAAHLLEWIGVTLADW